MHTPSVLLAAHHDDETDDLNDLTRRELLEHLPSPERAPIVAYIARLGVQKFLESEYALETPIDAVTGLVDHHAVVQNALDQVDSDYRWKAPFFDEHHLYYYKHLYAAPLHRNPGLALEFRDLPTNKIWVPRQFHIFDHAIYRHAAVPSEERMWLAIKEFRRRNYMYKFSTAAIDLRQRLDNVTVKIAQNGDVYLMEQPPQGTSRRKTVKDPESYQKRRDGFIRIIEDAHRRGLIDLSQLSSLDLITEGSIEQVLPEIKELMNQGLVRKKGHVALKVYVPYEKVA